MSLFLQWVDSRVLNQSAILLTHCSMTYDRGSSRARGLMAAARISGWVLTVLQFSSSSKPHEGSCQTFLISPAMYLVRTHVNSDWQWHFRLLTETKIIFFFALTTQHIAYQTQHITWLIEGKVVIVPKHRFLNILKNMNIKQCTFLTLPLGGGKWRVSCFSYSTPKMNRSQTWLGCDNEEKIQSLLRILCFDRTFKICCRHWCQFYVWKMT